MNIKSSIVHTSTVFFLQCVIITFRSHVKMFWPEREEVKLDDNSLKKGLRKAEE